MKLLLLFSLVLLFALFGCTGQKKDQVAFSKEKIGLTGFVPRDTICKNLTIREK